MSLKITEEQSLAGLDKALSTSLDNTFEMENLEFGLVERTEPKPGLLTALFGNANDDVFLETNTIKYDDMQDSVQLPGGKRFEEYGPDLKKDKARQMIYEVGSYGLRYNVAPKDYANKRQPGTQDLMDEAYLIAQMLTKAQKSWDLFNELSYASLLTSDQNNLFGGPMPQYDYYNDVYGTARPAATDMDLDGSVDHFALFGDVYDRQSEELDKAMSSANMRVILCGKNFYASRFQIEVQEGLAREVRGPLDLATMEVPRSNFGSGSGQFGYQWFDSHDGFRYIRYSASINGANMIGDNDAYAVPVGSDKMFKRVYAPAQDRENVNSMAQRSYAWTRTTSRTGVHVAQESNVLYANINPALIIPLTFTPV